MAQDRTPPPPRIIRQADALRALVSAWRADGLAVALVPTMGALHAGHLSLVERAKADADRVVVSVFVNPKQFSPGEDLDTYPRREADDAALLRDAAADAMFAPDAAEIYPQGFATTVSVAGLSDGLCGATRPNYFDGIATVVAKLFILADPDMAFFGEKDYQQLLLVRRMAADLGLRVNVVGCPIVRDADGLAMSSRNAYLSPDDRARARILPGTLTRIAERLSRGEQDPGPAIAEGKDALEKAGFRVDYFELRDAATLAPVSRLEHPARLLAGGYLGRTRLIDNVPVTPPPER